MNRARWGPTRKVPQRGQATVEFALVLPVLVLALAALVQVVLVVRDEMRVVHATRVAARRAIVDPRHVSAVSAIQESGVDLRDLNVTLSGGRTSGELLEVSVSARPATVPLVGLVLAGVHLEERLVVRVE